MTRGTTFACALRALLLGGTAITLAPDAAAQTSDPTRQVDTVASDATAASPADPEIIVIGSRIGGFAEGALPVSVVESDDLKNLGAVNTGELLAYVPAVGDVQFSDNNTGTNGARGDVAGVSLRGLGSGNTLAMIDGRRMVVHPLTESIDDAPTSFYNVNGIPSSAISRVEVLRDGASALYGADATAGVVNFVTFSDYEGFNIGARYGMADDTDFDEFSANARLGLKLNGGATRINVAASYYRRSPTYYRELDDWYKTLDQRSLLPAEWAGDTQFDNRSTIGPYGRYTAGRLNANGTFTPVQVRRGTTAVTSSAGLFYIAPGSTGAEVRSGSQPRDLRYDYIGDEIVSPKSSRWNASINLNHDLGDDVELFAGFSYYNSTSVTQRAAGPFDRSLALIIVPASNFYNPFGPVGSPNRLPGINAPAGGLDVVVEGYRPLEMGPRVIRVDQDSYRGIVGIRANLGNWDIDSALIYSEAHVTDEEFNRVSKTLLQTQALLTTPDAFNFFGGPNANSAAVLEKIRISGVRIGESTLAMADFKLSNKELFRLPAGGVGLAAGAEFRRETILDDSDPRLDGTIRFSNGAIPDISDVVGVSATSDFSGRRDVASAYMEIVAPLLSDEMNVPLVHRLELQLAGRFEHGSDFGNVVTPKIAAQWSITPWLHLRGGYGRGFRAPNLAQLNQGTITRRAQGDEDFYRSDVTGTAADIGDTYRASIREGNPELKPEKSETFYGGAQVDFKSSLGRFRFGVDYFRFRQTNLISTFGVEEQLALDFQLRRAGSSNPNVVRADPTPEDIAAFAAFNTANPSRQRAAVGEVLLVYDKYTNLDPRIVEGLDFSFNYRTPETGLGTFELDASATYMTKFEQQKLSLDPLLSDPDLAGAFASVQPDRLGLNGRPKWRATGSLDWSLDRYSAGVTVRYVGPVEDTSATNDTTGEFWPVGSWTTVNLRLGLELGEEGTGLRGTQLALGVTNLFNKNPPRADEAGGYFGSLHNAQGRVFYASIEKSF